MKFFTEKRVDYMKRLLVILITVLFLSGCTPEAATKAENRKKPNGVWLSYSEVNAMLGSGFKDEFQKLINNCQKLQIDNLYIHVRAFGDSLYKSKYFAPNPKSEKYDFDILKYVIDECHKNNISVHAWINPYRISATSENIEEIDSRNPAYIWLHDDIPENDMNVCVFNGIYLNPAQSEVQALIINGVREIVSNYNVDGIHFDDYFYPTQSEEFDKSAYEIYKNLNENPLELAAWRRLNVDLLLSGTYNAIKHVRENVIFSVSPAASIDNNYNNLYGDVRSWVDNGYIDVIIPQLYFGFDYPDDDYKFETLLQKWRDISALNPDVKLYIGLAFYKSKPSLEADISEWENNNDIIKRQVEIIDNGDELDGLVYFSYSSLVSDEAKFKTQRENLLEYLKTRD